MEKIKVGLASFGMSGKVFHAPFIHTNPHFELYKILERSKDLSKESYPDAEIVRDYQNLLDDSEVELIIVNTPDDTHYSFASRALKAGKHVIVEKPFTTTSQQGEELIKIAQEQNRMLSIFQNRRWDADFLTVQDILRKGLLGRLVEFESTFPRYRNFIKENTWKETGELGGGITYNLGSHLIDQAILLFGMPEGVYADIDTLRDGGMVDDYFNIHLIYPNVKVSLKAGYLMKELPPRFVIYGTTGAYVKYGLDKQEAALTEGEMPDKPQWGEETPEEWGIINAIIDGKETRYKYPGVPGNYNAYYQNIYEHLRKDTPLLTDAKDVIKVIKVIEASFKSRQEKKVIYL